MPKFFLAVLILLTVSKSLSGQLKKDSDYIPPIKSPFSFSGGFGELRRNHFHTGLDFRTSGQTGLPVVAVKDGSVARISVSPSGYGNALYLAHPDGNTTVYGHLLRFNAKIDTYVKTQQYQMKQFAVNLTLPPGLLSIKKGEIVAYSGNSGSSGGPHLHFEIRDTNSEKPQNPLFYLPGIPDRSSPRILSLYLYPLSENSYVSRSRNKMRLETIPGKPAAKLKTQVSTEVFGEIGIGIQTDDDFNGSGIKCGIYSIKLFLDQEPVFAVQFDHLAFDQGRYVNSYIDYEELIKSKRWIHRLFLQPGNKMEICSTNESRGVLKLTDGKPHAVKIVVSDAFNNSTSLSFTMLSKPFSLPSREADFTRQFNFEQANKYETGDVKINLPAGALYDNVRFVYSTSDRNGKFLSKIHHIHNQYVPLHTAYNLSIKTMQVPAGLQAKVLVVLLNPAGGLSPLGGEYSNGWITSHPRLFGDFGVVYDTIPPVIKPLSIKGNTLANRNRIDFKITDNLSGIDTYEGEIDGKWVLFEYDAKSDMLSYTFDKNRIKLGIKHTLVLKVGDERKNYSVYKANFYL